MPTQIKTSNKQTLVELILSLFFVVYLQGDYKQIPDLESSVDATKVQNNNKNIVLNLPWQCNKYSIKTFVCRKAERIQ